MKKIYFLLLAIFPLLYSCEKDTEDISKVTTYPTFNIVGGSFMNILVEDKDYTDPGITATVDGVNFPVETEGTVNLRKAGLYKLVYNSKSAEGYPCSASRLVLVTDQLVSDDYSGTYDITTTAGVVKKASGAKITLLTEYLGWYSISNTWWQASAISGQIVDFGGGNLSLSGNSGYGPYTGTGVKQADGRILLTNTFTSGVNAGYTWKAYLVKK